MLLVLILAIIVGFAMAMAIGANDVANSMATGGWRQSHYD